MRPAVRARILGALAGLAVLIGAPSAADAHAVLQSSTPAASSTVAESPTRIELRFNENIEKSLASIRLFDDSRREIAIGAAVRSGSEPSVVFAENVPRLDDGVYVVIWRVTSADGHPVTGAFAFQVGAAPSAIDPGAVDNVVAGLDTRSDLGIPLGVGKFLAYLGALMLIGSIVVSWRDTLASHPRLLGVQFFSLVVLTFGTGVVMLMQGAYASGRSWSSVFDATLINDVLSTRLGAALVLRVVTCVVWLVLLAGSLRGASDRAWWLNAAATSSFVTVASFSISGHASGQQHAWMWVLVDTVHVAAVAAWAGALIVLALVARRSGPDLSDATRRFSRLATSAMPAAALSGVVLGLGIVGGPGSLFDTDYGRILASKVVVVGVVVALGARARRRLTHGGQAGVRRTILFESILVGVVLALTAVLVGASPTTAPAAPTSFEAQLVQNDVSLNLSVVPARVGTVEVHALFTPPEGTLAPVKEVKISLSQQAADVPPIPVTMIELGPNHWSGVVKIPFSGQWRLEVRASPKVNSTLLFATTVGITG